MSLASAIQRRLDPPVRCLSNTHYWPGRRWRCYSWSATAEIQDSGGRNRGESLLVHCRDQGLIHWMALARDRQILLQWIKVLARGVLIIFAACTTSIAWIWKLHGCLQGKSCSPLREHFGVRLLSWVVVMERQSDAPSWRCSKGKENRQIETDKKTDRLKVRQTDWQIDKQSKTDWHTQTCTHRPWVSPYEKNCPFESTFSSKSSFQQSYYSDYFLWGIKSNINKTERDF
jgi:hypothetical protein